MTRTKIQIDKDIEAQSKICNKCEERLSFNSFYNNKNFPDNKDGKCKQCAHKQQVKRRSIKWKELFKYKGEECAHCGVSEPAHPEIYDFHHIDPEVKEKQIADLILCKKERLYEEADKCLMLCSNCHRKEHAKLRGEVK